MGAPECKFKKGDYIINRKAKDMAIFKSIDKTFRMHFSYFWSGMMKTFNDVNKYNLLVNYQDFWDLCTEEEKQFLDERIKEAT